MHSTWFPTLLLLLVTSLGARAQGVFDPKAEMCCGGEVHPLGEGCCHGNPFNASTHVCCSPDNRVSTVPLPDARGKEKRGGGAPTYECCGADAIDAAEQICCLGEAAKRMHAKSACCGSKAYDAERFLCCGGVSLFRRHGNPSTKGDISQCCGSQGYDPKRHLCCDGKLHSQWSVSTAACCGRKAYDIGFQICCNGQVINDPFGIQGCCGDTVYDVFLGLCCGNTVFPDPMRTQSCCGHVAYDPSRQTCCDSQITDTKITLTVNQSCCLPPPASENARDDVSEEGGQRRADDVSGEEPRPSDHAQAQSVVYERDEHVCCEGQVSVGRAGKSECCGGRAFDRDGEWECCGGRTLTRKLNKKAEAEEEARCCRGNVVRVPKNKQLCC